ncbi:transcriptional regulator LysR [Komagataeibacter europaeus NBRC 3261]|uniref:Transcriptional regulator LysR n=1 Tax=Komagataeibacter europaeus NBRC 3261 TaxID=1234669 RepID=A0A0D6Q2K2_KOMEU|nr:MULTISPECIES: LysR family transcriptional regulator [Acetobacteraceae]GAN97533.1 transcriptional regulator LysR [Komagataeibacter europaeus NBRC 3261]
MHRPPFDLWHLLCVRAIAEHGSIQAAARALRVKQSSVSRFLQKLEQRIGVELFLRSPSGTTPTPAGIEFINAARDVLSRVTHMRDIAHKAGRGERGVIIIGVQSCVAPGRILEILRSFLSDYPDVTLQFSEGDRNTLLSDLDLRLIDLAVVTGPYSVKRTTALTLWSEQIVAALPASHPLAHQPKLFWHDLRDDIFLIGRDNAGEEFSDLLLRKLSRQGDKPNLQFHDIGSIRILALVAEGMGIGLLTDAWIRVRSSLALKDIRIVDISDGGSPSHLDYMAAWRNDSTSPVLKKLVGHFHAERARV